MGGTFWADGIRCKPQNGCRELHGWRSTPSNAPDHITKAHHHEKGFFEGD